MMAIGGLAPRRTRPPRTRTRALVGGRTAVSAGLVGYASTLAVLNDMKASAARRVMRPAVRAGLTIFAREVKRTAPGDLQHRLSKLIETKIHTTRKGNIIGYVTFKRSDETISIKGRKVSFSNVANLLEFGTPHIKARAFMRTARERVSGTVMAAMKAKADERIDIEWKKANRRHKTVFK